ncbi:MAG: acetate--CoA ligase, partial [Bacteroidota bacterium]|nr:acetate--CoA ligase [Bacteroidota bacterium]
MKQITSFEQYQKDYSESVANPEKFWAEVAEDFLWKKRWDKVLSWNFETPEIRWFEGATCNLSENCLDRHLELRGEQVAIIWEPNDPKEQYRTLTYNQLHKEVCRFANVLLAQGVKRGDRVCIYLPMIPEAAIAMLACTRIGAIHTVVFAGFSPTSLSDRINDCGCKVVITADAVYRAEKKIELKKIVDEALQHTPSIEKCIVYNHRNSAIEMKTGRDVWWNDLIENVGDDNVAENMLAEDALFILYTSGSTGKPKGVLHTTAGYMVYIGYT